MKVALLKDEVEEFKPFSIIITFESEAEAGEFNALFNITRICRALEHVNDVGIRYTLDNHYDTRVHSNLQNKLVEEFRVEEFR